MDDYSELIEEISESERILKQQEKEIARLKSIGNNNQGEISLRRKYQIIGDRKKLEKKLKSNRIKLKDYKLQLSEIEKKIDLQKNQIEALSKENDKLKIRIRKNSENRSPKKKIKGVSDLRKSFGFILKEKLTNQFYLKK
jgi:chromosome segregation ATPase